MANGGVGFRGWRPAMAGSGWRVTPGRATCSYSFGELPGDSWEKQRLPRKSSGPGTSAMPAEIIGDRLPDLHSSGPPEGCASLFPVTSDFRQGLCLTQGRGDYAAVHTAALAGRSNVTRHCNVDRVAKTNKASHVPSRDFETTLSCTHSTCSNIWNRDCSTLKRCLN